MSDFLSNILDKFIKKSGLNKKYIEKTKELLENKDLDYIIYEDDLVADTWKELYVESYKSLLKEKFYLSVGEYILEGHYDQLSNKNIILLLLSHLNPKSIYKIIQYIYPLLDDQVKYIFNYKYIVCLFMCFELKEDNQKIIENKDYAGLSLIINEYHELIDKLICDKIILNQLFIYQDKQNQDKPNQNKPNQNKTNIYEKLSIYDLFVYSSYIKESYHSSLILLKIILDKLSGMSNDQYQLFNNCKVNIDSLDFLSEEICSKNLDTIDHIANKSYSTEKNNYYNTPLFYINKLHFYMSKNNAIPDYKLYFHNINQYIDIFYSQIFTYNHNTYFRFDDYNIDDYTNLIRDVVNIDNEYFYKYFIESFKFSNITPIDKIHFFNIIFRSIYLKLNKYNRESVKYICDSDKYYIVINKKHFSLERNKYLSDIQNYLEVIPSFVSEFIISEIRNFIHVEYPKIKKLEKYSEHNKCVICLNEFDCVIDQITKESVDKIICIGCNNLFHESCINSMYKNHIDNCPICVKPILSTLLTFSQIRYNLFNDILVRFDNYKSIKK